MAEESRCRGEVRWFSDTKGYGFIKPEGDGEDLFVHHSSIKSEGYRSLTEGEIVEYTFSVGDDDKPKAVDVTGPNGASIQPPRRSKPFLGGGGGGCFSCGGHGHIARECVNNSRTFSGGPPRRGGGSGGDDGSCYNCGQVGHFARECRRDDGGGSGDVSCYKCGQFGHFA
ncbi:unnamed protein product [Amaranthus hypochondriacus]